jgi:hypothetical protein
MSKIDAARDAARALARVVTMIEVLLIDPTHEGLAVANAVVQRGKVTQVTSDRELTTEVSESGNRQKIEHGRVMQALAKASEERAAVVGRVSQNERLSITVGYPGSPAIEVWLGLTAYLHLPDSRNEVEKRLTIRSRDAGQKLAESSSHISAMRGTWFTLIPRLEGVTFNPPQQEVAWLEDVQEVPFRFLVGTEFTGRSVIGGVEVLANGVCIAIVPISLTVGEGAWSDADNPWETSSGSMFEEVFASYSRKDLKIVDACAAAYKALGVHLFVDRRDLLGGQEWHPALLRKIEQADAFQLFWSSSSCASRNVEDEWKHAMQYRSQKGHRFLRPLYWEEPKPAAPIELNRLNFAFLDLNTLGSPRASEVFRLTKEVAPGQVPPDPRLANTSDQRAELSSALLALRAGSVNAPVVPLLAGESRQSVAAVSRDVSRATAFLEDLSGLRYYPVPTLIVDEFVVRRSREVCHIVDDLPEEPKRNDTYGETEIWTDILGAMLLQFHVRRVPPFAGHPLSNGQHTLSKIPAPALESLRQFAEWGIGKWLWSYRFFPWEEESSRQANVQCGGTMSETVTVALDKFIALVQQKGIREKKHEIAFGRPTSSDPAEFDDRTAWEAVNRELEVFGLQVHRKTSTFVPPVAAEDSWGYEATGSTSTLIAILVYIREQLAARLPKFDDLGYSSPEGPDSSGMFCIGLAVVASKIADRMQWELSDGDRIWGRWVDDWVIEVIHPSWRRVRDWMAAGGHYQRVPCGPDWLNPQPLPGMTEGLNFHEFLGAYFALMEAIFREGLALAPDFPWSQDYGISKKAWDAIEQKDADLSVVLLREESWGQVIGGSFGSFVALFQRIAQRLLSSISTISPRDQRPAILRRSAQEVVESSVFGAFITSEALNADSQLLSWAIQQRILQQSVLPETNRVLYCAHFSNHEGKLSATAETGRILRQCTLLHEHFHALLETGTSADYQPARGPADGPGWTGATGLNESLAVWVELHFVRRHGHLLGGPEDLKEVTKSLWAYVHSGDYPAWPYGGAEKIEVLYLSQGISAVRSFIERLRDDPIAAQRVFDEL